MYSGGYGYKHTPPPKYYAVRVVRGDGKVLRKNLVEVENEDGAINYIKYTLLNQYPNGTFAVVYMKDDEERFPVKQRKFTQVSLDEKEIDVEFKTVYRTRHYTEKRRVKAIINHDTFAKYEIVKSVLGNEFFSRFEDLLIKRKQRYDIAVSTLWNEIAPELGLAG